MPATHVPSDAASLTPWDARRFLRVLHLRGTAAHRGALHGSVLAAEVIRSVEELVDRRLSAAVAASPRELRRAALLLFIQAPREAQIELSHLAQAAGLELADAAALTYLDDVWERFGCTAIAVPPDRTSVDGWLVGHNTDVASSIPSDTALVTVVEPEGGIAYACLGWAGVTGTYVGLNVAGVAIAANVAEITEPARAPAGPALKHAVATALTTASSAREAAAQLSARSWSIGTLITVVDVREGWRVESGRLGKEPCLRSTLELDVVANHFATPGWSDVQPADWLTASIAAEQAARSALAHHPERLTERDLARALAVPGCLRTGADTPTRTTRSTLLHPATRRLWVAQGGPEGVVRGYLPLSLDTLLRGEPGLRIRPFVARMGADATPVGTPSAPW